MRLLLLAALALSGSGPGTQTITGTIAVNTGTSLTVISADRKLTCAVAYGKGQAAILKWGTGARVAMACTLVRGRLVVTRLARLDTTEPQRPTTTTPTTTEQKPATPPTTTTTTPTETRPAPTQERREATGVILALTSGGVGIQPDGGLSAFTCAITAAADSQAAAAKLKVGARAGIVCRLDGGRWVLSGASPIT
jgi:hypothetical protein